MAARLNIPTIFVSGGPMLAGKKLNGKKIVFLHYLKAVGQYNAGTLDAVSS